MEQKTLGIADFLAGREVAIAHRTGYPVDEKLESVRSDSAT
jgi:hypothetical protein